MFEIGIIGAGKIGSGIIKGLVEKNAFKGEDIILSDVSESILNPIKSKYDIVTSQDNKEVFSSSKVIVLAVKPNLIAPILESAKDMDLKAVSYTHLDVYKRQAPIVLNFIYFHHL